MKSIAVIQFPGSNCIKETIMALKSVNATADVIRWNCDHAQFNSFDAYILPGGFSFQDRVRAGVISAKLPIMSYLLEANDSHKPILGICNGCQILAESGLVPDYANTQSLDMALAPNTINDESMGFICDWVHVKINAPEKSLFTQQFSSTDTIPIPINHGEGRFVFNTLPPEHYTQLTYVKNTGQNATSFPHNPNGSTNAIAGISNQNGNVLAMMPHPERAYLKKQVPNSLTTPWSTHSSEGPWLRLFASLKEYLER